MRVYNKSYEKTHRHVHRIYCKNKNCIISSCKYDEYKLATDLVFSYIFAAIKQENNNSLRRYKREQLLCNNFDRTAVSDLQSTKNNVQQFLVHVHHICKTK